MTSALEGRMKKEIEAFWAMQGTPGLREASRPTLGPGRPRL